MKVHFYPLSMCAACVLTVAVTQALAQRTAPPLPPPPPEPGQLPPVEAPAAVTGPKPDPLTPTLVSLKGTDLSVTEALEQLHNQCGYTFRPGRLDQSKRLTLDLQSKPLWEALIAALGEGNGPVQVTVMDQPGRPGGRGDPSLVGPRNFGISGRLFAKGPFLVAATTLNHSVDFELGPGVEMIDVNALLVTDFSSGFISSINNFNTPAKATDDLGNSLVWTRPLPDQRGTLMPPRSVGQTTIPFTIRMECPAATHVGKTISVMEGIASATFNDTEAVEIPTGRSLERKLGGATILVDVNAAAAPNADPGVPARGARGRGGTNPGTPNTVFIRLNRDPAMPAEDWQPLQNVFNTVQVSLVDADGKAWQMIGSSAGSGGDFYYRTINFRNASNEPGALASAPVKARIELPVSSKKIEIPYHFENLPIP